jgi:short-subunit dehydrogenase
MLHSNLRSPFVLTRRLLPSLLRAQGDVVFMNSSAVFNPRADNSAYTASKAALKSFADCLRAELNPGGVRVLTVYPGRTATPMQAEIFAAEGRPYRPELLLQPEDVASSVLGAILLPRTAELTELQIRPALKG